MNFFNWHFGSISNAGVNDNNEQQNNYEANTEENNEQDKESNISFDIFENFDALIDTSSQSDDFEILSISSSSSSFVDINEKTSEQIDDLHQICDDFIKLDISGSDDVSEILSISTQELHTESKSDESVVVLSTTSLHDSTEDSLSQCESNENNSIKLINFINYKSHKYDSSFGSYENLPELELPEINQDKYRKIIRCLNEVNINRLNCTTDPKDWFEIFKVILEDLNINSSSQKLHGLLYFLEDDVKCRINITGLNFVPHSAKYIVIKETLIKRYEMSNKKDNDQIKRDEDNSNGYQESLFEKMNIGPLWLDKVEEWFNTLERIFESEGIQAELEKEFLLMIFMGTVAVNCLNKTEIQGFPKTSRYKIIKEILIHKLRDPIEQNLALLFDCETLGKKKPSVFLKRMYKFAYGCAPKKTIRRCWIERLPVEMQIAVSNLFQEEDSVLLEKVDQIYEMNRIKGLSNNFSIDIEHQTFNAQQNLEKPSVLEQSQESCKPNLSLYRIRQETYPKMITDVNSAFLRGQRNIENHSTSKGLKEMYHVDTGDQLNLVQAYRDENGTHAASHFVQPHQVKQEYYRTSTGSTERNLELLLNQPEFELCQPSELLKKMNKMSENLTIEKLIRKCWLRRLPLVLRNIVSQLPEDEMAAKADELYSQMYHKKHT